MPQNLPRLVKREVTKVLSLLHEQDLVFSDGGQLILVGFCPVGRDGEGRYSACLDPAAMLCASAKKGS